MKEAPRVSETINIAWLRNKIGRLALRLWRRDFIRRRPRYVRPLTGGGAGHAIAYNQHGAYCVPLSAAHRPAARYVMAGRVWEQATLDYVAEHIGDGDLIHAGAFFGDFLPFYAACAAPGARIWAYEPSTENYHAARLTCALGSLDNVRLAHAGLGPANRDASLVVRNDRGLALGGASYVSDSVTDDNRLEPIRLVAIDDDIPSDRDISIIQLDTEGFEQAALSGALKTIERCRPLILVESAPSPAWFDEHLKPFGYRHTGMVDDNHIFKADSE